jgi:Divergent InlB B-repeat domain
VTLTAAAASGSTFAGWSGACTGTGSCTVTMNAAQSVTATFNKSVTMYKLTVAKIGTGRGTVTSSPAGINCGTVCSASYASGTVVTLTATPSAGSTFSGWSGACTGKGSCSVTMTAAKSVKASFTLVTYPLTVTKAGNGTGTVKSTPSGINCGLTCSHNYPAGTVVTLTATPGTGHTFGGWSGACTGTGKCKVTMTAAEAVQATFN